MAYVFSRSVESVAPDYAAIAASGATIALNAEDPHLAQAMADARAHGMEPAIWIPAHQGQDPLEYAKKMASIVQFYKPGAILPNIEGLQGKSSSGGTEWSNQMMAEFQKYVAPGSVKLGVVTEPGETDFNYNPYLAFGGEVVNESFTGDMQFKDPDAMRQKLIDAGVPPDRINMLLAPGQKPGANTGGNFSAYTWDDMKPEEQAAFLSAYAEGGGHGSSVHEPTSGSAGGWQTAPGQHGKDGYSQMPGNTPVPSNPNDPVYNQVPDVSKAGYDTVDDAHNPLAQAYARKALAANGIKVPPGADAAAMWRDFSGKRAADQKAVLAGESPGDGPPDPWQKNLPPQASDTARIATSDPGAMAAIRARAIAALAARTPGIVAPAGPGLVSRVAAPVVRPAIGPGVISQRTNNLPAPAPAHPAGALPRVATQSPDRVPALTANIQPSTDPAAMQRIAAAARAIVAKSIGGRTAAV